MTPSQGSHFFQNLAAGNIGYFTVNPDAGEGFVDWEWLAPRRPSPKPSSSGICTFDSPIVIAINGRSHAGVILKPAG